MCVHESPNAKVPMPIGDLEKESTCDDAHIAGYAQGRRDAPREVGLLEVLCYFESLLE